MLSRRGGRGTVRGVSVDVWPHVYAERREGRGWRAWSVTRKSAVTEPERLAVGELGRDEGLMMIHVLTRACPGGAKFCDEHEEEFARFEERARPDGADPEDPDYDPADVFSVGALTTARLREIAERSETDDAEGLTPAAARRAWGAVQAELRRWAAAVEQGGGSRVVYWFEVT